MIQTNTRFNPTTNGPLHIGHLYVALVNEHEAHRHGDKFILRFDDNQFYHRWVTGGDIPSICREMLDDLQWCGVHPDVVSSQSELQEKTERLLSKFGYHKRGVLRHHWTHAYLPETKSERMYPYVADYTAEKVIQDMIEGVSVLIRGVDLLSEFSLYNYFCDLWDIPIPKQVFLPRLRLQGGVLSDVSKTLGNCKIRDYRGRGVSKEEVLTMLRTVCLKDIQGDWTIENVKNDPILQETPIRDNGEVIE